MEVECAEEAGEGGWWNLGLGMMKCLGIYVCANNTDANPIFITLLMM